MTTPRASAIVLAGGRSSRFGRDKLAEPIDGVPMLHRTIEAVARVASEVIVVGPVGALPAALPDRLPVPVRLVMDRRPFAGPLEGIAAGAAEAKEELVLVVGGDMPWVAPAVLSLMLQRFLPGRQRWLGPDHPGRSTGAGWNAPTAADGGRAGGRGECGG